MSEAVVPLAIVRARAIGGFRMRDDKGRDDKIVAIAIDDPAVAHYTEVGQLPPHTMRELRRFFQDYKALEGKVSEVDEPFGLQHALAIVGEGLRAYRARGKPAEH